MFALHFTRPLTCSSFFLFILFCLPSRPPAKLSESDSGVTSPAQRERQDRPRATPRIGIIGIVFWCSLGAVLSLPLVVYLPLFVWTRTFQCSVVFADTHSTQYGCCICSWTIGFQTNPKGGEQTQCLQVSCAFAESRRRIEHTPFSFSDMMYNWLVSRLFNILFVRQAASCDCPPFPDYAPPHPPVNAHCLDRRRFPSGCSPSGQGSRFYSFVL